MMTELIAHLESHCPAVKVVEMPTRINPLERDSTPVITIYPIASAPPDTVPLTGAMARVRTLEFRVTARGVPELDAALAELSLALTGHRLADAATPFVFIEGELIALEGVQLQWADRWQFTQCTQSGV